MKDQVTSIEQSKRLIEMGVPADKASMVWVPGYEFDALTRRFIPNDKQCFLSISYDCSSLKGDGVVPAFTVADMLGMMPIRTASSGITPCTLGRLGEEWSLSFHPSVMDYNYTAVDLTTLLYDALVKLLSNGYELNL